MATGNRDIRITSSMDLPSVVRSALAETLAIVKSDGARIAAALKEALSIDISKLLSGTNVTLPKVEASVAAAPAATPPPVTPTTAPNPPPAVTGDGKAAAKEQADAAKAAAREEAETKKLALAEERAQRKTIADETKAAAKEQAEFDKRLQREIAEASKQSIREKGVLEKQAAREAADAAVHSGKSGNNSEIASSLAAQKRELQALRQEQIQVVAAYELGGQKGSAAAKQVNQELVETTTKLKAIEKAEQDAAATGKTAFEKIKESLKGAFSFAAGDLLASGIQSVFSGLGGFLEKSFNSVARIERLNAQTEAVVKSTGGAAGVTAAHVEELTGNLENLTATEAESIQQGANMLLTFTNIKNGVGDSNQVFDRATGIITDMARAFDKTGAAEIDTSGQAIALGKALNDPSAGFTKLRKIGVTFTEDQIKMGKAMQANGDIAGAQGIILDELQKEFGGSAEAFAQTTKGQIELAKHALGTFGESIVQVLAPAVSSIASVAANVLNGLAEVVVSVQEFLGPVFAFIAENKLAFIIMAAGLVIFAIAANASAIATALWGKESLIQLGITKLQTLAQWDLNAAMEANPIGAIVLAIAALVAILIIVYNSSTAFRNAIDGAWASIKGFFTTIGTALLPVLEKLWSLLKTVGTFVGTVVVVAFKALWTEIKLVGEVIFAVVGTIFRLFAQLTGLDKLFKSSGSGAGFFEKAIKAVGIAIDSVIEFFGNLTIAVESVSAIFESVSNDVSRIADIISNIDFSNVFASIEKIQAIVEHTADKAGGAFKDRLAAKLKDKQLTDAFTSGFAAITKDIDAQITKLSDKLSDTERATEINKIIAHAISGQDTDNSIASLSKKLQAGLGDPALAEGLNDAITEAINELNGKKVEIKSTTTEDPPPEKKVEAALDLQSTLVGIAQKTQAAKDAIEQKGINDSVARQRAAISDRAHAEERAADETARKTRAAIDKAKRIEVEDKDGNKIEISKAEAKNRLATATAEFKKQRELQATQEVRAFDAEQLKKSVDEAAAAEEKKAATAIGINNRKLSLLKGGDEAAAEERKRLTLENFDKQATIDLTKTVKGTEEFTQGFEAIQKAVREGLDPKEGEAQVTALFEKVKSSSEEVTLFLQTQADQRVSAEQKANDAIALARAGRDATSTAEVERAIALEQLSQRLRDEEEAAKGQEAKLTAIRLKGAQDRAAIERKFLQDSSNAYNIGIDIKKALEEAFTVALSKQDLERLKNERSTLDKEGKDLLAQLRRNEVSYKDFSAKAGQLADKRRSLDEQGNDDTNAKIKAAGIKAAETFEKTRAEASTKSNTEFLAALDTRNTLELSKKGKSADEQAKIDQDIAANDIAIKEKQGAAIGNMVAASSAAFLTMLAQGQNANKAFGALLFNLIEQSIPGLVALLTGQAFAVLGPILGPIASGALTGVLLGLVQIGKSALKLRHGISSVPGNPADGDSVHTILMPGERVVPTHINQRHWELLEVIQKGGDPLRFMMPRIVAQLHPELSAVMVNPMGSMVSHQHLEKALALRDEAQEKHHRAVEAQLKNINGNVVKLKGDAKKRKPGESTIKNGHILIAHQNAAVNALSA